MVTRIDGADIVYPIRGDLGPLKKDLSSAEGRFDSLGKRLGNVSKKIGTGMTIAGGAITGAFGLAAKSAMDFDKAMAEISTLGVKNLDKLSDSVRDVAQTYGLDLTDSAKAAYQAISAGASEMEAPRLLENAARAARAGVTDLTTSIELGTSVTNAFGTTLSDVNTIYDQAFIAVKNGVTTFEELGGSVGRISPIFAAANLKSEEMFASIAALTKGGIKTREAVSGLKAALANVIKPTSEATKLAEKLGLEFNAAALESEGLAGFMDKVKTATGGNIDTMSQLFGSVEGLNVVLALTGEQGESLNSTLGEMQTATGATQKAFDDMAENDPAFTWDKLKTSLANLAVEVGKTLLPLLRKIAERITPIIQKVMEWIDAHPQLFTALSTLGAAVGALMLALGPVLIALPGIATALGAILSPAGAVAAAIGGALVAAFFALRPVIANVRDWIAANWDRIKATFDAGVQFVATALKTFAEIMRVILTPIAAFWAGVADGVSGAFGKMFNAADLKGAGLLEIIQYLFEAAVPIMEGMASAFGKLADFMAEHWDTMVAVTSWGVEHIVKPVARMIKYLVKALGWAAKAVSWVANAAGGAVEWLTGGGAPPVPEGMYKGGKIERGKTYTVGEQGPELFLPLANPPRYVGRDGPVTTASREGGWMLPHGPSKAIAQMLPERFSLPPLDTKHLRDALIGVISDVGGVPAKKLADRIVNYRLPLVQHMHRVGMRAAGGPVAQGMPYIVGERGQELFVPDTAGSIINNAQTSNMMSGGNTTINVNVARMVANDAREVQNMSKMLAAEFERSMYGRGLTPDWGAA